MRFESRTFWIAKDLQSPQDYQDAWDLNPRRGVAAIADGVTSAIFSGPWARLLTQAIASEPPELNDPTTFQTWLNQLRAAWMEGIDLGRLTWFQKPKMVDGGMTTLLWLELTSNSAGSFGDETAAAEPVVNARECDECNEESSSDPSPSKNECGEINNNGDETPGDLDADDGISAPFRLRCHAIGDSCLFHIRAGRLIAFFPLEKSEDFGLNPQVIGSMNRNTDDYLQFHAMESDCWPGDLLVLCTDAIALWAVNSWESGEPIDWERYWDMSAEQWQEEILALRRESRMRYDDTTLILLRVTEVSLESAAEGTPSPDDMATEVECVSEELSLSDPDLPDSSSVDSTTEPF